MSPDPPKTTSVLGLFVEDFLRYRWGDCVGMFLVLLGAFLVVHYPAEVVEDLGKSLVAGGLFALRPRTMGRGGTEAPKEPTK